MKCTMFVQLLGHGSPATDEPKNWIILGNKAVVTGLLQQSLLILH